MSATQIWRLDEIENWRQKAYTFSRTDRLGHLIIKSLDVAQTIVRDGTNTEALQFDVESLKRERTKTMNDDLNSDDQMRSLLYGMSASIGLMIESIIDKNEENQNDDEVAPTEGSRVMTPQLQFRPLHTSSAIRSIKTKNPNFITPKAKREVHEISISASSDNDLPGSSSEPDRKRRRASGAEGDNASVKSSPKSDLMCTICDKEFVNEQALKCHYHTHKGFRCDDCGRFLKSRRRLEEHRDEQHFVAILAKNDLNAPVSSTTDLESTMRTDPKLQCSHCGYTASYRSTLEIHVRSHTGEKPFKCDQCALAFASAAWMKKHLRDVHGVKPYECRDCGEQFDRRVELQQHGCQMEHISVTNDKTPRHCPHCDHKAKCPSTLEIHLRSHTGERPFTCDECGQAFVCASNMRKHLRKEHAVKPYECRDCGERFDRRVELQQQGHQMGHNRKNNVA